MSTYYYAIDHEGFHLFDNFPTHFKSYVTDFPDGIKSIEVVENGVKKNAKIGRKSNNEGTVYTLTTNEKYVIRHKLFKEVVDLSIVALNSFSKLHRDLIKDQNSKTEEFIHNIVSLNTYSIQDLFSLVPQQTLTENFNKQNDIIRTIISEKPNVTATTLLKLIKYNVAMKVEFSVFDRTQKTKTILQKMSYSIREIVLSALQIFIDDFENKKITVFVDAGEASERRIEVDYDSLFVSLFYLLDNSIKYCCNGTDYKIVFKEENNCFSILFIMISIKIDSEETDKLTINGYRSTIARLLHDKGNGIGMYRIQKTLQLNNAELEITPRINSFSKKNGNIEYQGNQFKIKFLGQNKWI